MMQSEFFGLQMITTLALVFLDVVLILAILLLNKKKEKKTKRTIGRI